MDQIGRASASLATQIKNKNKKVSKEDSLTPLFLLFCHQKQEQLSRNHILTYIHNPKYIPPALQAKHQTKPKNMLNKMD
jgi:hypothetical protein